jgi:hypothetical protein
MSGGFEIPRNAIYAVVVIALITIGVLIGFSYVIALTTQRGVLLASRGALSVSLKMVIVGYGALFAATAAHAIARRTGSIPFLAANIAILVGLLGIGFYSIRRYVTPGWMVFSAVFVILVQLGAHAFSRHRYRTIRRLLQSKAADLSEADQKELVEEGALFDKQFSDHSYAYAAVPGGAVIGAIISVLMNFSPYETVRTISASVAVALLAFILYFLVVGVGRIAVSFLCREAVTSANLRMTKGVAVVRIPPMSPESESLAIDGACVAADVRKLFLYNQYQQLAVAIALATLLWHFASRPMPVAALILIFLSGAVLAAQIPYIIGQQRAHDEALGDLQGVKREEVREKLAKYCPVFPGRESLLALSMSGTAGGFLFKALEKIMTELLAPLAGQ